MVRYELLLLTVPEITKDEALELEKSIERCVKKSDASLLSFDRWGKYRLAYPVRKNEYGVYFLSRMEITTQKANELLNDLRSLFTLKLNTIVMRDLVSKLSLDAPLTYQRPDSLEETPIQDVNSFLRKNKMNGLISSGDARQDQASEESNGFDVDLESGAEG